MSRWTLALIAVLLAVGCTWPPSLATPPVAQNPAGAAEEQAEALPAVRTPSLPSLSPPAAPLPRSGGGLL